VRHASLDGIRGLAILMMVFSGVIPYKVLPAWMYHAQLPPPDHVFSPTLPGITWVDLVFPMFVFIAGVSLALSLPRRAALHGRAAAARGLILRAVILFAIGVLFSGGLNKGLDEVRWLGVLQRIAIASLGAGLLSLWLGARSLAIACGTLLLGYWALGPLAYLLGGPAFAARWWVPGLIPIGLGLAALAGGGLGVHIEVRSRVSA
jgi:predicted acyltransferase